MAVSISQVFFEHHHHGGSVALGIGESQPRISWRFEGDYTNWTQGGYTIQVSRDSGSTVELFDVHNSSQSHLVPWPTVALSSAESATVRVRAYGSGGGQDGVNTAWSDAFTVEPGLLSEQDWSGALMIAEDGETEQNQTHRPVLFRNDFELGHGVVSARLYITAFGLYDAYINGERVGDGVLAPGWQSYAHRLVYDTYDVTSLLRAGTNAIGVQVGEGWYAGRLAGGHRNIWGDTLGVMALLVVTGTDGTRETVATDLGWQAGTGPIVTSEIYDGETYDARREEEVVGWSAPAYQMPPKSNWTGVKALESPLSRLAAPDGPPMRRIETVQLREILQSPSGKTILDFGQNLVGWLRLSVAGPAGQNITLRHVEVLEHGEIATEPLRTALQTDHIILSGNGTLTWEPTFTYHGFRYVQVSGWPMDTTPLNRDAVMAIVVHSDMQQTGSFECSDALINKLHENVAWSMKGNFMSIPTDCPQRDERLGWTGDAHAFAPTANFLYDTAGFWRGWMKDVHSEQMERQGIIPAVVPLVPEFSNVPATAVWGDIVVANPWNTYLAFGDKEMLREEYVGAKVWIDVGIPRNEVGLWNREVFQWGDWLDPLAPPDDPGQATTAKVLVADAYLVYVTSLVAKMAAELGLDHDAVHYSNWAADLKAKFRDAWIDPVTGTVANETQTGIALPLYFDLFATSQDASAAAERLDKIIANNNYLVGTGFAGTHLLGLALTEYNLTSTFYKMLLQTTTPSWLYQVVMGATTTWERWDSMLANGSLNDSGMTSFNHYAFGSVANWIHRVIGGLAPADPGWTTVRVNVIPGGGITEAKTHYLTPYGTVSTEWKVDEVGFHLNLYVPPNSRAEVILPGQELGGTSLVGSGRHEFTEIGRAHV